MLIQSLQAEYLRYKALAEAAMAQVDDSGLAAHPPGHDNSIAALCWHISGNLESRFTDFLTSDGEKPWRDREQEFGDRSPSRAELLLKWARGWDVLLRALSTLTDDDLARTVSIRRQPLQVTEALLRSLAHVAYHVGQIVYVAKALQGDRWRFLSIPPGQSDAYNQSATLEKPSAHAHILADRAKP